MIPLRSLLAIGLALVFLGQGYAQNKPRERLFTAPRLSISQEGDPMQLKEMSVSARIVGLQAEVTTAMTFHNPNGRQLEGELEFPLPDGALVTGYALDVNGKMVDGVVVKKEKARVAFETETRTRIDPGLVEHVAGNIYRTRIYPLPPRGERRIQLRYVTTLAADAKGDVACFLPMPLGETVGKLSIRVEVAQSVAKPEIGGFGNLRFKSLNSQWVAETEVDDAKPGEDLWVALPKLPAQVASVERTPDGETFFAVSEFLDSKPIEKPVQIPTKIGIAWDASGSRAGDHEKELAMLKELLAQWQNPEVVLVVFRNKPEQPRVFTGNPEALLATLKALPYDGGTDLAALTPVLKEQQNVQRWFLCSDGLETLGGAPPNLNGLNVSGVVNQTMADREGLRQICTAAGGMLIDLQTTDPKVAAGNIVDPAPRLVRVRGTGIADVQGLGTPANGRVQVVGKLLADEAELSLEYSDGHVSPAVKISKKSAPEGVLIGSVWAGQRIAQLGTRAEENEEELLTLGRQFGVVSPATSLIVLENLDQYVRHDIEPPAMLPEMRTAWAQQKASVTKNNQNRQASKLERVVQMWNNRLHWWNAHNSKQEIKKEKGQTARSSALWEVTSTWQAPAPRVSSSISTGVTDTTVAPESEPASEEAPLIEALTVAPASPAGKTATFILPAQQGPPAPPDIRNDGNRVVAVAKPAAAPRPAPDRTPASLAERESARRFAEADELRKSDAATIAGSGSLNVTSAGTLTVTSGSMTVTGTTVLGDIVVARQMPSETLDRNEFADRSSVNEGNIGRVAPTAPAVTTKAAETMVPYPAENLTAALAVREDASRDEGGLAISSNAIDSLAFSKTKESKKIAPDVPATPATPAAEAPAVIAKARPSAFFVESRDTGGAKAELAEVTKSDESTRPSVPPVWWMPPPRRTRTIYTSGYEYPVQFGGSIPIETFFTINTDPLAPLRTSSVRYSMPRGSIAEFNRFINIEFPEWEQFMESLRANKSKMDKK